MKALQAVIAAVVLVAMLVVPGQPAGAAPGDGRGAGGRLSGPRTVTLVTGDIVRVSTLADGRQAVTVEPGGPSARHGYQLLTRNGDSHVIPLEAAGLLAVGRLDEALFNVTDLVADGYDDASRPTLPLVLTPPAGAASLAAPATPAGAVHRMDLPSIRAVAVAEDKARARTFWESIANPAARTLDGGIGKVWLDRKVRATLTDSVRQIGAPEAWAKGLDGTGVSVAVLDTGYDPAHPNLAGKVGGTADFTGAGSAVDTHGHGTHVAATVAGAGSVRPGVAPGARLLIGRVLDGNGEGDLSWAITGMEWAAGQGAKVVNMSFGAGPSDGSDPLSEAVNNLTRSTGTLFVSAAGNSGPDKETVDAPGTATDALTVGAVSKSDTLAGFSSRGPRIGDAAVKPELTAPGVGIIAARASGTALGELIDAGYTSLSGTSMATPHVAGAAALLAQQHPDWQAAELKAALVGSARPVDTGAPATALGAGRVDVPAALRSAVLADTSSVAFGHVGWTGEAREPRTTKINYRNISSAPVTIDLAATAHRSGNNPPAAALTVTPGRLTIAPGAAATATLRLDPDATPDGSYTGQLVATGAGGSTVRVPVGFEIEGQTHALTVSALDRLGRPAGTYSQAQVWNLDTGEFQLAILGDEGATLRLPPGRYALMVWAFTVDEAFWERELTMFGDPQLTLTGDRTMRFDARRATPWRVVTPQDAELRSVGVAWQRVVGSQSILTGFGFNPEAMTRLFTGVSPPATDGTFELVSQVELAEPKLTGSVLGPGGYRLPNPRHVDGTPPLSGLRLARVVDGRDGTPEQLAGARGAAVLIRLTDYDKVPDQLRAAAEAGARLVVLRSDSPGFFSTSAYGATVPAYILEKADTDRLLDRLAAGRSTWLVVAGTPVSPYHYQLLLSERGRIPANRTYDTRRMRLATVESEFHDLGGGGPALDTRHSVTPTALAVYSASRLIRTPLRRTDYLNTGGPGTEITWLPEAAADLGVSRPQAVLTGQPHTYRPGERGRDMWFPAITRPAMPPNAVPADASDLAYGTPVNRANDAIRVAMPQFANGSAEQYGWLDFTSDRARLALRRDGVPVGETNLPFTQFTVPGEAATYQLTLDAARDQGDGPTFWTTSTATSTTWTFRSARPTGGAAEVLPLLQVGYELDTDLRNTVQAWRPYPLVLRPGYQPGAKGSGPIEARAEISYDDGKTWRRLDGRRGHDGAVTVWLHPAPRGATFATLRVSAWDRAGNRIDQTITRAWRVAR